MTEEQVLERLKEKYPEAEIQASDMTGTGSNFQIYIKSPEFEKLTRVQRHQAVMSCFSAELESGEVHALAIKTEV